MVSGTKKVCFQKYGNREGPWRFREAKSETKTRLFEFNATVKVREGSVKDSVKGFCDLPNLVPLADPSSAVHNFTNKVGIRARGIMELCLWGFHHEPSAGAQKNLVASREGSVKLTWSI